MAISTMKPINFNRAGQFGIKPRIMPKAVEQKEEIKKEVSEEIKQEVLTEESTKSTTLTESFMCPNCSAEFDSNPKLRGHMLKYTRNQK